MSTPWIAKFVIAELQRLEEEHQRQQPPQEVEGNDHGEQQHHQEEQEEDPNAKTKPTPCPSRFVQIVDRHGEWWTVVEKYMGGSKSSSKSSSSTTTTLPLSILSKPAYVTISDGRNTIQVTLSNVAKQHIWSTIRTKHPRYRLQEYTHGVIAQLLSPPNPTTTNTTTKTPTSTATVSTRTTRSQRNNTNNSVDATTTNATPTHLAYQLHVVHNDHQPSPTAVPLTLLVNRFIPRPGISSSFVSGNSTRGGRSSRSTSSTATTTTQPVEDDLSVRYAVRDYVRSSRLYQRQQRQQQQVQQQSQDASSIQNMDNNSNNSHQDKTSAVAAVAGEQQAQPPPTNDQVVDLRTLDPTTLQQIFHEIQQAANEFNEHNERTTRTTEEKEEEDATEREREEDGDENEKGSEEDQLLETQQNRDDNSKETNDINNINTYGGDDDDDDDKSHVSSSSSMGHMNMDEMGRHDHGNRRQGREDNGNNNNQRKTIDDMLMMSPTQQEEDDDGDDDDDSDKTVNMEDEINDEIDAAVAAVDCVSRMETQPALADSDDEGKIDDDDYGMTGQDFHHYESDENNDDNHDGKEKNGEVELPLMMMTQEFNPDDEDDDESTSNVHGGENDDEDEDEDAGDNAIHGLPGTQPMDSEDDNDDHEISHEKSSNKSPSGRESATGSEMYFSANEYMSDGDSTGPVGRRSSTGGARHERYRLQLSPLQENRAKFANEDDHQYMGDLIGKEKLLQSESIQRDKVGLPNFERTASISKETPNKKKRIINETPLKPASTIKKKRRKKYQEYDTAESAQARKPVASAQEMATETPPKTTSASKKKRRGKKETRQNTPDSGARFSVWDAVRRQFDYYSGSRSQQHSSINRRPLLVFDANWQPPTSNNDNNENLQQEPSATPGTSRNRRNNNGGRSSMATSSKTPKPSSAEYARKYGLSRWLAKNIVKR